MNKALLRKSIQSASQASYSRSGGPGGQNVNKLNTKVTLRVPLDNLEGLSLREKEQLKNQLVSRETSEGFLVLQSSEERSAHLNLERALIRAEEIITAAAKVPKKRRPTKPSAADRERRLQTKHRTGEKKKDRRALNGGEA